MAQKRRLKLVVLLGTKLMFALAGCVTAPRFFDPFPKPIESGDLTAPIAACGEQILPGYALCRKKAGSPTSDSLTFYFPPVKCSNLSCGNVKIFSPTSQLVLSLNVPKGETKITVPWQKLLNKSQFETTDRGLWAVIVHVAFFDQEGMEHNLFMEGEIRLRVYSQNYLPLVTGQDDPFFQWSVDEKESVVKFTTTGRTYVGPKIKP